MKHRKLFATDRVLVPQKPWKRKPGKHSVSYLGTRLDLVSKRERGRRMLASEPKEGWGSLCRRGYDGFCDAIRRLKVKRGDNVRFKSLIP